MRIVVGYVTGKYVARRWLGIALLSGGGLYFVGMFFRLLASVTFAAADSWFGATIPAFFHVVLACFVLIHGYFNLHHASHGGLAND